MWPYQHLQENVVSPSLTEAEEVSSYSSTSPMSPHATFAQVNSDTESDSEELLQPNQRESDCSSVDLLLLKSLESYAAVQRTTAVRQLRCECSEVLSVHSTEDLRGSRVLRPPMSEVLWPNRYPSRAIPQFSMHSSPANSNEDDEQSQSDFDDVQSEDYESSSEESRSSSVPNTPSSSRTSCTVNTSLSEGSPPPDMSQPRRRLRSVQNMPQPSLLAKQVANRVIKYARCARNIHEEDMCCLNCGLFPTCPVTGKCGHTRCTKCTEVMSRCPCGHESPKPFFVNILIRDLIGKTLAECPSPSSGKAELASPKTSAPVNELLNGARGSCFGPIRSKRRTRPYIVAPSAGPYQQHIPMSARARFTYALELLRDGRHKDAAPHLALAAASCHSDLRVARPLLAQVIMVLSRNRDPRSLTRELNHLVRHLSIMPCFKRSDMECILCSDIFTKPVTTPCGHMFCRTCLEKTLDYRKRCPLCLRGLGDFKLTETNDTVFVKGALASINALNVPKPMEDDLVPIFVCTVAYPSVPCPLFIFDPKYWLMIRRVLESGTRRFGMVAMDRDKKYADYGTILEVRDCVHLEDGRSILSTIGLSRFKVIERSVRDGCEVARIQPIHDIPPDEGMATDEIKMYASQILLKAILWLSQLGSKVLSDIENAFGSLPTTSEEDDNVEWWESSDGPSWLWWLVAVLPLRTEIKVLILSTDCLLKRMMAVARTLEAVEHVALTTMTPRQYQLRVTVPNNDDLLN